MEKSIYLKVKEFKKRFPLTIAWNIKKHCKVLENFINPTEEVLYAFCGQRNDNSFDIITSCAVVLTNKRILIGQQRVLGYIYIAITPDMFNDLNIKTGPIWGSIYIDTIKETVVISNLQKSSLDEIETSISEYMMNEKLKYGSANKFKE